MACNVYCKVQIQCKYVDGSAIVPGPDSRGLPSATTPTTTEASSASSTVDTAKVEAWLDKKEAYEVGFEQAKKECFMSVNKSHLATILELSTSEEMFEALDKKYSATKRCSSPSTSSRLSTQKNVAVMEKYEATLSLNAEIRVQKCKSAKAIVWMRTSKKGIKRCYEVGSR